MMTSLNKTRLIEKYLDGRLPPKSRMRIDLQLARDKQLRVNVFLQKQIRVLLRHYRRKQMSQELERIHRDLFSNPMKHDFQETIREIFET